MELIIGILIDIRKPWNNPIYRSWFNGWKKMYCMNNTMVIDHHGLFIYLDLKYPCSFHNVSIMCEFELYKKWCQFFVHTNEYFEQLLGNPCYWVKEVHYALAWEVQLAHGHDLDAIIVFNKMHVGYRVTMEWGIDGLM